MDWANQPDPFCFFEGQRIAPAHLPLKVLLPLDLRDAAQLIFCHQDIASDSAFSLGMLAELDNAQATGSWCYHHLF